MDYVLQIQLSEHKERASDAVCRLPTREKRNENNAAAFPFYKSFLMALSN